MEVLKISNLNKRYKAFDAVKDLNLSIHKGEIFCLLGQNGAGKTTTINLILGFIKANSGIIKVNNIEVVPNENKTNKLVAYIPEVVQLYGNLTGIENLDFFSRLAGFNYNHTQLKDFLLQSNLQSEVQESRLETYSKGMRQKVGIAIALAKNADLIVMDEPTSGLDPKATTEFTKICKELANEGKTILMATHDIFNAVNVGTRIGIMKAGTLVHSLTNKDITADELQKLYLETI